MNYENRLIIFY